MHCARLPFQLTHTGRSGFRSLLSMLPLDSAAVVVDIGAGGLGGRNTTDHILDFFCGRIIGVQMDKDKAEDFGRKYGNRVEVRNAVYGEIGVNLSFDLIVFDLSPPCSVIYDHLLKFSAEDGLKPGGYAICLIVYDPPAALTKEGLFVAKNLREGLMQDLEYNRKYFGAEILNTARIAAKFADNTEFEFVSFCEKWFREGILGHIVLRRRGKEAAARPCIVKIPKDLSDTRASGFRTLLSMLPSLGPDSIILEIEEARHFGETTDHLVQCLSGEVVCFRRDMPALELTGMAAPKLSVRHAAYGNVGLGRPFDVIVFGGGIKDVPLVFGELLQFCSNDGLKSGGYAICGLVYDVPAAFEAERGYFRESARPAYSKFMQDYFGSEVLDSALLKERFNDSRFEFVGLVDRWLDTGNRGLGWVVLRKR